MESVAVVPVSARNDPPTPAPVVFCPPVPTEPLAEAPAPAVVEFELDLLDDALSFTCSLLALRIVSETRSLIDFAVDESMPERVAFDREPLSVKAFVKDSPSVIVC